MDLRRRIPTVRQKAAIVADIKGNSVRLFCLKVVAVPIDKSEEIQASGFNTKCAVPQ